MANTFPRLLVPDNEIGRIALMHWTDPTKYQATVMTCIALMESDGDARAWYYNTEGLFAETFDRGLWGINEAAIAEVLGRPVPPTDFAKPVQNGQMARAIWNWRYQLKGGDAAPSVALPYAYSGWTTYRKARIEKDANYAARWNLLWRRAVAGTGYIA